MSSLEILGIIPVYNERESLETLLQEITATLISAQFNFEIVFVDDGSHDGTPQYLNQLSKKIITYVSSNIKKIWVKILR